MRTIFIGTGVLTLLTAVSIAAQGPHHLTLREKRAACAVAFHHVFYRIDPRGQKALQSRESPSRIFLEAQDEAGREVTPAATIAFLRHRGLDVHPAWTERRWRPRNETRRFVGANYVKLTQFKYLSGGRIEWRVEDWGIVSANSVYDNSLIQDWIVLKQRSGRWVVVEWRYGFAAG